MKAIDLLKDTMIGKHIPQNRHNEIIEKRLLKAHIDCSPLHIRFTDGWEDCMGYEKLQQEICEGYWTYTHHTKEKFYEYAHHSSIEKALELIKTINGNPYSEDTKLYFIYKDEVCIVEVRGLRL